MSYTQCVRNGQPMYFNDPSDGEFPTVCEACKCGEPVSCDPGPDGMGGAPAWAQILPCPTCTGTDCTPTPSGGGGVPQDLLPCITSAHDFNYWEGDKTGCVADLATCCASNAKCPKVASGQYAGQYDWTSLCGGSCQADAQDYCEGIYGGGGNGPSPPGPTPPGPTPPQPTPRQFRSAQSQSFLEQPTGKAVATGMSIIIPILVAFLLLKIMKMK